MSKCQFCGSELNNSESGENLWEYCECPICGRYKYNQIKIYAREGIDHLTEKASYLYYHNKVYPISTNRPRIVFGEKPSTEYTDPDSVYYPTEAEILDYFPLHLMNK